MQVPLCRHIRSNGQQCQAVALRNSVFCYFHRRQHHSPRLYRSITICRPDPKRKGVIFDIGILKDRAAIQIAISRVVQALASNQMDLRHARSLLYGLQLAMANTPDGPQEKERRAPTEPAPLQSKITTPLALDSAELFALESPSSYNQQNSHP